MYCEMEVVYLGQGVCKAREHWKAACVHGRTSQPPNLQSASVAAPPPAGASGCVGLGGSL